MVSLLGNKNMAFIKHGDGKIMSVVETENLTEEQKETAKKISANNSNKSIESNETDNQDAGRN